MFHTFHNARQKEGAIHPTMMPIKPRAARGMNGMFLSIQQQLRLAELAERSCHATIADRSLPRPDQPGVMVNVVTPRKFTTRAAVPPDAIAGKLNSAISSPIRARRIADLLSPRAQRRRPPMLREVTSSRIPTC